MVKKRKTARTRTRRNRIPLPAPMVGPDRPENYVSGSFNAITIGSAAGSSPNKSLALNESLINNSTNTQNHLQLGTGTNYRLGKHVFFTNLHVKLTANCLGGYRIRVIVMRSDKATDVNRTLTQCNLTSTIESGDFLEAPQFALFNAAVVTPVDYMISTSTDYTVCWDKVYGSGYWNQDSCVPTPGTSTNFQQIDFDVPLMVQRMYDQAGNPDQGDWFIYFCTNTGAGNVSLTGTIRVDFINQWNFESIGNSVKRAVNVVGDVANHVGESHALRLAMRYGPSVLRFLSGA